MRLDVASGQKQEVFRPNTGYLRLYALSPDGSQIVFNWRKESDLLYVLPATGGEPKLLYEYPKNEYSRAWGGLGEPFSHASRLQVKARVNLAAAGAWP